MFQSGVLEAPLPSPLPTGKIQKYEDVKLLVDPLCEAMLKRLLPAIGALVEEAAASAASRALQAVRQLEDSVPQQNATQLGTLQAGQAVTVDWVFANTGPEAWPEDARLQFRSGSLAPPPGFMPAEARVATPPGSSVAVRADMVAPQRPGPCEAQWQLEAGDGSPLSPPLFVNGLVRAVEQVSSAAVASALPASAVCAAAASMQKPSPVMAKGAAGYNPLAQFASAPNPMPLRGVMPQQTAASTASGSQPSALRRNSGWKKDFEDFFGRDAIARFLSCRDRGQRDAEVNRMINQVWEYMKRSNLQHSLESCMLDQALLKVFAPFLPPGSKSVYSRDILPLITQAVNTYSDGEAASMFAASKTTTV